MPLITSNEAALLQTEIEQFESPIQLPVDIVVDDPLQILIRYERPEQLADIEAASAPSMQLSINEELSLKKYMNMAVAEKLVQKGSFLKID